MTKQFAMALEYRLSIITFLLFLLLAASLRLDFINDFDHWLYNAVAQLPGSFKYPLFVAMQAGSIFLAVTIAAFAALSRQVKPAVVILAATVGSWLLVHGIKLLVARPRPMQLAEGYGFPSSHAAVAAALMFVVTKNTKPAWKLVACAVVLLAGIGRIYSGFHFPIDVAGGVLLGVATASGVDIFAATKHRGSRSGNYNI